MSLAIFALAAVSLGAAYSNVILGRIALQQDEQRLDDLSRCRAALMETPGFDDVEAGGEIDVLDRADELGRQLSSATENMQLLDDVMRSRRELENTFDSISHLVAVAEADDRRKVVLDDREMVAVILDVGGQQQRVAIARALAKNPKVIIADEPTGNLDSKNTQDIMNIIKKISLNKLVVLVTHEENIANFYGDRIIRLQDGQIISDIENSSNGGLDVKHETDIYLGDLRKVGDLDNPNANISIFSDEEIDDALDIRLIVKNKTIYLDVKSKEYKKIQLIESDSEINIKDGKYEKLQKTEFSDTDFKLDSIITANPETDKVRHSVITIKDSLKLAVSRLKGASKLGKLFYVGFGMGAVLIAVAIGMLSGIYNFDSTKFLSGTKEAIIFDKDLLTYDEIVTLSEHESVNYLQYVERFTAYAVMPPLYQVYDNQQTVSQAVVYEEYLDESKIIKGRGIQNMNEFVMDNDYADQIMSSGNFSYLGITSYDALMKLDFIITLPGAEGEYKMTLRLVGIVEDESPVMYASKELIYMSEFHIGIYEVFEDDITIETGRNITGDNEILVNSAYITYDENEDIVDPVATQINIMGNEFYEAVGTFSGTTDMPRYLIKTADIEEDYFNMLYTQRNADINFHSNDITATIA